MHCTFFVNDGGAVNRLALDWSRGGALQPMAGGVHAVVQAAAEVQASHVADHGGGIEGLLWSRALHYNCIRLQLVLYSFTDLA